MKLPRSVFRRRATVVHPDRRQRLREEEDVENALDVIGYAFCRKCNGHLHPDDLIEGMCLWCWANEPDEGGGA